MVHYMGGIIIRPIEVEDGVKFWSKGYCEFLEDHFTLWYRNSKALKKLVLQQSTIPPGLHLCLLFKDLVTKNLRSKMPSLNLNFIRNLKAILKKKFHHSGKHYS